MSALQLDGVTKAYGSEENRVTALDKVDFTVGDTETVVLMGPSGSGKTTLLTVAGALLSPDDGTVRVGDEDITQLGNRELARVRREQVGFVFQNVNLVPFLTARENLLAVSELGKGRGGNDARERADTLLDELGLSDRADNLPGQLSGGQRQRVAIGRALMNQPSLILVDEPTSSLDTKLGHQVMELLSNETRNRGVASVIVTHDERVTEYGDRVVHITDGQLED